MATCGADGRAGTHVNAAGLAVKEGTNEKQHGESAVHTGNTGMGHRDCCTGYERLVQTEATAACEDDTGGGGPRRAPHPAVCPGVRTRQERYAASSDAGLPVCDYCYRVSLGFTSRLPPPTSHCPAGNSSGRAAASGAAESQAAASGEDSAGGADLGGGEGVSKVSRGRTEGGRRGRRETVS